MQRLGIIASSLFLIGLAPSALAGGFGEKTMRAPMPTTEVERSLILPRGWVETKVDFEQKVATASWNSAGERVDFDHSTWLYRTERLTLSLGYGPHSEMWFSVPFHQARLTQDRPDVPADYTQVDIRDNSIGDPKVGWRVEILRTEAPLTSVVFNTYWKGPAASEAPGTFIGGPLNVQGFVFTTGTPDAYFGVAAKRQFGPASFTLNAGYMRRFSSTVQYLIELENMQFLGRIAPGDELQVDTDLTVQAGPVALHAGTRGKTRAETRVGTTSGGIGVLRPDKPCGEGVDRGCLRPLAGSGGAALDVNVSAQFMLSRGLDFHVGANIPVVGEDFMFFPIEDLHPTAGTTINVTLEARY